MPYHSDITLPRGDQTEPPRGRAVRLAPGFPGNGALMAFFLGLFVLNGLGVLGLRALEGSNDERARLVAHQEALKGRVAALESGRLALQEELDAVVLSAERLGQLYNFRSATPEAVALTLSTGAAVGGPEAGDDTRFSPSPDLFFPLLEPETPPAPLLRSSAAALPAFAEDFRSQVSATSERLASIEAHIDGVYDALSHIPSIRPVSSGFYSSPYGPRVHPITGRVKYHHGLDIVADIGAKVMATADGVVRYAGPAGGMGRMVEIDHGNGLRTRYGHNSAIRVREGQTVRRGQTIARVGMTGDTTGPHCHYVVLKDLQYTNPRNYINED